MTIGGWIAFVLFAALILCAGIAGACLIENVLGKIISVAVAILLIWDCSSVCAGTSRTPHLASGP